MNAARSIAKHSRSKFLLASALLLGTAGTATWFFHKHAVSGGPITMTGKATGKPVSPRGVQNDEAFADFNQWLISYARVPREERGTLLAAGRNLVRKRRQVMESLIQSDPRAALQQAVTLDVWENLPQEIQSEVEEPFSALADYKVYPVCLMGSPDHDHFADGEKAPEPIRVLETGGASGLACHVFGRRDSLPTKLASPVQGIRLGGSAALREEVFHELAPSEVPVAETTYPLANSKPDRDFATGLPLGTEPVVALSGGKVFKFADEESFKGFSDSITALDQSSPAPRAGASVLFLPSPADGDSGSGYNLGGAITLSNTYASGWTETKKKLFMIRCDFSDKPDSSYPTPNSGSYSSLLNTTVSNDIRDFSYGKTWIEASVSSTVTRLPSPSTYYDDDLGNGSTRNADLLNNAKAAYQAANPSFVATDYDIVGVWFVSIGMKGSGVTYAGLAGGSDLWIQGTTDAAVHVHELGHNYGLGHSSSWAPPVGSTDPVDAAGTSTEYGDVFDVMGDGPVPQGVYHAEAKQRLNWLATGDWSDATATGNGVFRIYQIDNSTTAGPRGLRVTKGPDEYFWLSYRRLFDNNWLKAGANIVWKQAGESRSWLIDTTPGSMAGTADKNDSSIAIGRTFTSGNISITPVARGGNSPNEYLDIRVNTGPFPGNSAPAVTLNGPSSISARQTCIFTAQATDANGDELAYSWDFGQGFTFDNNPEASVSWNTGGTFTVKVTVSDMKGGVTQATKTVTVLDPLTSWTARANSSTGDFNTLVASPNKVLAAGSDFTSFKGPVATSTDGATWTATQLGQNQHAYGGVWDGSQFLLAGMDYDFGIPSFVGCVFTSPTANAGTWTRRIFTGPSLDGIAYGGGVYIAVGASGTIRRSTDGTTWTPVASGTTNTLNSVAYGGGKFVAVGYLPNDGNCVVLTSPDGLSWTNTSSGTGFTAFEQTYQDLRNITWANDRFIASGWYGKVRYSLDLGNTFSTTRTTNDDTPGLAYGKGVWFATGRRDANSGTEADIDMVSSDGVNWTDLPTPSLDNRNAAIFFNNTFITAGANHSIRQSGTITASAVGYGAWRDSYFPDHGPATNPSGDADADGAANLLEYSLGAPPASSSGSNGPTALPQAVIVTSEPLLSDRLALEVSLPEPAAADLVYTVEAATDPGGTWATVATKTGTGNWVWNGGGTSRIVAGTPSGGRVQVTIGDSVPISSDPERFMRLRVRVNQ